jgi:hypothetical protein
MADGPTVSDISLGSPSYISETGSPIMDEGGSAGATSLPSLSQLLANQSGAPLMLGLNMSQGGEVAAGNSAVGNPGLSLLFYSPSATDSAGTPLPGATVPTTYGLNENLALTRSDGKAGDSGLSLGGMFYMSNGSHALAAGASQPTLRSEDAVSQNISYKTQAVSFSLNYRDVGKGFAGDDALNAMAGQNGSAPTAAIKDLLSHKGQSDWNLNLGLANTHGLKAGFLLDNLTDQNAHAGTHAETFSLSDTFSGGLGFSASHAVVNKSSLLGGPSSDTTTDNLHLSLAPVHTGLFLNADQTVTRTNNGSENTQTKLDLADHFGALSVTSSFNLTGTSGLISDHAATQHVQLVDTFNKTTSLTTTWDGASDAKNRLGGKNDFDAVLKTTLAGRIQTVTELTDKDDGNNKIQAFQSTFALPSFAGMKNANWKVNLTNQTSACGQQTQTLSASMDSTLPTGKVNLPPTLPGATLHLEYAGNLIGADPQSGGLASHQSSRALRIVSGPVRGNWLSWSLFLQNRDGAGVIMPSVRDFMVQAAILHGGSLTYTSNDQLPANGGAVKDLKEQELKLAAPLPAKKPLQLTADYLTGADNADNLACTQTMSVGIAGPISNNKTLDVSLGRTQQLARDGGFANGTTYKVAYKWNQDESNMLNLASSVTYWDSGGSRLMPRPVDATAQLAFKRVY